MKCHALHEHELVLGRCRFYSCVECEDEGRVCGHSAMMSVTFFSIPSVPLGEKKGTNNVIMIMISFMGLKLFSVSHLIYRYFHNCRPPHP